MYAAAARGAIGGFARMFPSAMRYMARNPGLGGRVLRSGAKALSSAGVGLGAGMSSLKYLQNKIRERTTGPISYKKRMWKKLALINRGKLVKAARRKPRMATTGTSGRKIKVKKAVDPFYQFNRKGVVKNVEVYGTENSSTCVYVEAAVTEPYAWIVNIIKALVRKLLQKAGLQVYSCNEVISMRALGLAGGDFEVVLYVQNQANVSTPAVTYSFVNATTTVTDIAAAIKQPFISYAAGSTNSGVGNVAALDEPNYLVLQRKASPLVHETWMVSNIQLDNCLVYGKLRCIMKIQNQTKATTGGSESDDVTNQPLVGKLYYFNGLPRTKVPNQDPGSLENNIFRRFPADRHLKILKDSNLEQELREPISPKSFWNCIGCTNLKIQPGEIRTFTFYDTVKKQPFLKYLKKFHLEYGTNAPVLPQDEFNLNYCPLKFAMIALEEEIQSSSEYNLTIGYEIESRCGSVITELRPNYCRTETESKLFPSF